MSVFGNTPGSVRYVKTYDKQIQGMMGMVTCRYELYEADTAQAAKNFLATKSVYENLYYIVVETPEGNWGKDIQGMYQE